MNGGILSNGYHKEGVKQAFDRYEYHLTNDQWKYPMEYLNEGITGEIDIKL